MPTYEYECQKCGHEFEAFQSITAEPLTRCNADGCKGKVQRLIGAGAGLLFKGSGFYITDYRSEGYKSAAKADRSEGSGKGEGGGEKSGSKSKGESSSGTASKSTADKSE